MSIKCNGNSLNSLRVITSIGTKKWDIVSFSCKYAKNGC